MWERITRRLARRHIDRIFNHLIAQAEAKRDAIGVSTTIIEANRIAGASLALSGAAGWVLRYRRGQV